MLHFIIAAARPHARAIDERLVATLEDPDSLQPPDAPGHSTWASADGRLRFAGWTDDAEATRLRRSGGSLAAIAGDPIVVDALPASAPDLLAAIGAGRHGLEPLLPKLQGVYGLLRLDEDGTVRIVNDHASVYNLYVATTPTATLIGDKVGLLAAAMRAETGKRPPVDLEALAMVAAFAVVIGDATGHAEIRAVPYRCGVRIGADGTVDVSPVWPMAWEHETPGDGLTEPMVDSVEDLMTRIIRGAIEAAPEMPLAELTAGKDSRLVLAMIHRAGLTDAVQFYTFGPGSDEDTITAATIADRLGLRFGTAAYPTSDQGFDRVFVDHVMRTGGQVGSWESARSRYRSTVTFSGVFGESLRYGYDDLKGITSADVLAERWAEYILARAGLLLPAAQDRVREQIVAAMLEPLADGVAVPDLGDVFRVRHRIRRNVGLKHARHDRHVYPLFVSEGVRVAFRMGTKARAANELMRALMQRSGLALDDIPYGKVRRAVVPGGQPTSTSAVDPIVARHPRLDLSEPQIGFRRGVDEHGARSTGRRLSREEAIRKLAAEHADSAGWNVIDRRRFHGYLGRYDGLTMMERIRLHWALTAILFAGDQ